VIVGFGSDLVDIRRIEKSLSRFGARFESRFFTEAERKTASARGQKNHKAAASFYAKRFAAKEAFLKAVGTGFRGVSWQEMEVRGDENGAPSLHVSGDAAALLRKKLPHGHRPVIWLTLADEYPYAQAQVILEAIQP
jgi:holo-[acyl-carrier protein] synthase